MIFSVYLSNRLLMHAAHLLYNSYIPSYSPFCVLDRLLQCVTPLVLFLLSIVLLCCHVICSRTLIVFKTVMFFFKCPSYSEDFLFGHFFLYSINLSSTVYRHFAASFQKILLIFLLLQLDFLAASYLWRITVVYLCNFLGLLVKILCYFLHKMLL